MFTVSWIPQCDTYMTIPKWRTSTQCTNGAVQSPPAQTHTVNTGEEIWILVVATKYGAYRLSGQLQFKVKQPSGEIFAAGIATGGGVAIVGQVIYLCIISPRYSKSCRKSPAADIPMSPAHPAYAGFFDSTEEPANIYDNLSPAEVITNR
ncbi:uncharacterized protein LOC124253301 isoform X2 [Haliotis rubra]|uniref:uncharacterized protein LOC124253301 isoform X2 n=1 Tax=Haliotis rubra TaxID=36100 RepID=UPI001EE5318C|nr:uncharacterized protein LOC124253301 isoform X2 [Haliotis rubra]